MRRLAAIGIALLAAGVACAWPGAEPTAFVVKGEWNGKPTLQPMTPMILVVERAADAPPLAKGEVLNCKTFRRTVKVVETDGAPGIVHEVALNCAGKVYIVRGIGFE